MIASRLWEKLGFRRKIEDSSTVRIQAQVLSDSGCHRDMNEDSACCIHPPDALLRDKGVLAIVADGMGGHPAGDVASQIATDTIAKAYYESPQGAGQALHDAFALANAAIRDAANSSEESKGMGATCTAIALLSGLGIFGHIGDTRLYRLRRGDLLQLTGDQTRVMKMVREGLLSHEEARTHEDRNVVLEALGQRQSVEGAQWGPPFSTEVGDQFILCSDGLHDLVRDEEIRDLMIQQRPEAVCPELIALAKCRGGYDNITVVVLRVLAASNTSRTTSSDSVEEVLDVATNH
jgi:PPM family protein phosphatase